jgi:hypothetical protein
VIRSAGRQKNGRPVVALGLEPQNLSRLREGQPIVVNLRNLDPDGPPVNELPDLDVLIYFAGKDENRIIAQVFGR